MRYPQMFATKAIEKTLDNKINKGIIWHTKEAVKQPLLIIMYITSQIIISHSLLFLNSISLLTGLIY